jgi:hypothetical protein
LYWENYVKPIAKTDSCQSPHTQYMVYGQMDNGTEQEFDLGDALILPPPEHNAWVIGNEAVFAVDY